MTESAVEIERYCEVLKGPVMVTEVCGFEAGGAGVPPAPGL